jgi:hypothetical protein
VVAACGMGLGRGLTNWLCECSTWLALEDVTTSLMSTLNQKRNLFTITSLPDVPFELVTSFVPFLSSWACQKTASKRPDILPRGSVTSHPAQPTAHDPLQHTPACTSHVHLYASITPYVHTHVSRSTLLTTKILSSPHALDVQTAPCLI